MLIKILDVLLLLIAPFLFIGIINKTKAFLSGRQGASVIQPFFDFIRLMRKGQVISSATSQIFQIAPLCNFCAVVFAAMFVPFFSRQSLFSFNGDLILFAYLLSFGKFLSIVSSMETGSSFEGMGAAREASFSAFAEPALFIIFSALCAVSGNISLSGFFASIPVNGFQTYLILLLAVVSFAILLITEGCRVPVDDPCTHLELTMIHEVMVLDNSGPDLAMINYSAALKMVLFGALISNIILSPIANMTVVNIIFPVIIAALAVMIGIIETFMARLRMVHAPQFIIFSVSISFISIFIILIYSFGGIK